MSLSIIPNEPETAVDAHAQRTERHLQALDEMLEIGLDLTRLVQQQAKIEVEAAARLNEPAPDFTLALDRVTRIVRRTILLAQKIGAPARVPAAARTDEERIAARHRIIRKVEDSIDSDAPADEAGALHAELLDRLDSPELADDIEARPVDDIIMDIRRDLGIAGLPGARGGKRRTPTDVALLCVRAARLRPAAGPFVLPMPPGRWDCNTPLFGRDAGAASGWGPPPIRGP